MAAFVSNNPGNVVPVNVYSQTGLTPNILQTGFNPLLQGAALPVFYIGDEKSTDNNDIVSICAQAPLAQTNYIFTRGTASISVKTKTKFFGTGSGEYYLAIYAIEDGLSATGDYQQTGNDDPSLKLNSILRGVGVPNANYPINVFGAQIANGTVASGTYIDKDFTVSVNPNANINNIHISAVIWKKEGSSYKFINAF